MGLPKRDKRVESVQTQDSRAKIWLVKEPKSIDLEEGKYVLQGIKRAIASMPLTFMIISLVIWAFSIIGFFVYFLLKLA
jgi:hypothetical protein